MAAVNITQYAAQLAGMQDQLSGQATQEAATIALLASGSAVSTVDPGFGGGRVHSVYVCAAWIYHTRHVNLTHVALVRPGRFVPSSQPLSAEFLLTNRVEAILPLTPTRQATILAFVQDSFGAVTCSCVTASGTPAVVTVPAPRPPSKASAAASAAQLVDVDLVEAENVGDTTAVLGVVSVASTILQDTGDPLRLVCSASSGPLSPAGVSCGGAACRAVCPMVDFALCLSPAFADAAAKRLRKSRCV